MLPFLEPKNAGMLVMDKKKNLSTQAEEKSMSDDEDFSAYRALATDIISAIQNKSPHDLAQCLQSLCEMMEGEESEIGPSEGYEDQY